MLSRWLLAIGVLTLAPFTSATEPTAVDYLRDVKPILAKRCFACHGVLRQQGGLRLDTVAAMKAGGESGTVVVSGQPDKSLLVAVVTGNAGYRMPPENEGAPLTDMEIETLKSWILAGAAEPAGEQPQADPREFWSYRPVVRPSLPAVMAHDPWSQTHSDVWVRQKQIEQQLVPQPPATAATWLRRAYLDLIGIPPTPEQVERFVADDRPDARHRVVDELLANPLYGQRWGRHWMDVWRYSDWYGSRAINEIRYGQRHSWRWRDWIIESLNADLGYDQMILAMLAGDEFAPGDANITRATGFLGRNWYKFDRNVWMFETVEQTSQAFLGLTMRCARCHDHKFDPISQEDYYHFRAFFEPHDVRTDPIGSDVSTEKDATLGQVLRTGVSLAYDKQLEVPTYRFERGDSRKPDTKRVLSPAVPAILGGSPVKIEPIKLPLAAVAPYLRDDVTAGLRQQQLELVDTARRHAVTCEESLAKIRGQLAAVERGDAVAAVPVAVWHDDFSVERPGAWQSRGGAWRWEAGRLTQTEPVTFPTLLGTQTMPRDFALRLRYTTLAVGTIHSVGLFFDASDLRDAQAVYTAIGESKATVQAFHRVAGVEHYPSAGIFPCSLRLNEPATMDVAVRGQQLNVWLNGELVVAYAMPVARRDGLLALWTHAGGAVFHELQVYPLPPEFLLAKDVRDKSPSPLVPPTLETLRTALADAERNRTLAEWSTKIAEANQQTVEARIAAERAKVEGAANAAELATIAAKQERHAAVLAAERDVVEAERRKTQASVNRESNDANQQKQVAEAEAKLAAAQKAVEAARLKLASTGVDYTPLGPTYPSMSTGRRLALARWIVDESNPRTARVAVNHLWLRHFGEAIVPSVANFGPNGRTPSHPELLDWLASEFMERGWSMKQMHRHLLTSSTYAIASSEESAGGNNQQRDPSNVWLWRMNPRRMESELVRDAVLSVAGELDLSFGGPELPESAGLESRRRSLYFRSTPNEKMTFLELFDQANPNECYRRQESVVPQQSLALFNSPLALSAARRLAASLLVAAPLDDTPASADRLISVAFEQVLSRPPSRAETEACRRFLDRQRIRERGGQGTPFPGASGTVQPANADPHGRAAENLVHVLLNHHEFVTIR